MEPSPSPRRYFIRAIVATVIVVAAMVVGRAYGQIGDRVVPPGRIVTADTVEVVTALASAAVVIIAGVVAIRSLAKGVRRAMEVGGNQLHGAPLGFLITFIGYVTIAICVLAVLNRPVGGLLLGGALTGVLIGIAAQQVLANFFAGIVLLVVRPFTVADEIVLKSGPLGGEYEGVVVDMGLFYVRLQTHTGPVALPNSGVLASAVGPGVRAAEEPEEDEGSERTPGS